MSWAAVVTVGGSILSGIGASKKDKKNKAFASSEARLSDERLGCALWAPWEARRRGARTPRAR